MDPHVLQRFTTNELDRHVSELDDAIESHSRWLASVNRALIFGSRTGSDDLGDAPHLCCHFGRWYRNVENEELLKLPEFTAIGDVHRRLHLAARRLLRDAQMRKPIHPNHYDEMVELSRSLRYLLTTVRRQLKENLSVISKLMAQVFEGATEGVVITDRRGVILSVNTAFTEVTGHSPSQAIGKTPRLLRSGKHGEDFYQDMYERLQRKGEWEGEIWNQRRNGDVYLEWLSIFAVKNDEETVTHYVGIFSDITEKKENEERLYYLAHFDPLTGLPNRILFMDRFRQAIARARRNNQQVAVLFLDLDGFKEINDSLGHAAGDTLLQEVAQRLSTALRESDTIARFGGDEFTVILPDMPSRAGITSVSRKIIDTVDQSFRIGDELAQVTTSIGVAMYPEHGQDADNLLTRADYAMYEAKKAGKNNFCFFSPDMQS